ncbi:hypothetical protein [Bifidobacterium vansinderenii]|nr:hypothetical protein [Bifidobacterium vansinderenii]
MRQKAPARLAAMMVAMLVALAALATVGTVGSVPVRAAGATVSVSVQGGTLNPDAATTVDLSGSGFQSVQGGFGGIYVLFGWVSDPNGDSWKPSKGGVTGETYRYVPDDENNPTGYDVFVAFPGDPTASAANGGQIASDGTWRATITVPGAKFTSVDRSNNPVSVDCTAVQCGIITIGAHGVANATNETFTPMTFGSSSAQQTNDDQATNGQSAAGQSATETTDGSDANQADQSAAAGTGQQDGANTQDNGTNDTTNAAASAADSATTSRGNDMTTSIPTLGVAGWLLVAAVVILGISTIALAAGIGGYLAAKALLLGISPAALDREAARRERRAATVRAREEIRTERHRRKLHERLLKERARADKAQAMAEGRPADFETDADAETAVTVNGEGSSVTADARPSIFVPGGGLRSRNAVQGVEAETGAA